MKLALKLLGGFFAFAVLFAIMTILVPALISAKSTVAVIAGITIVAVFFIAAVVFVVKQFSKTINIEDIH